MRIVVKEAVEREGTNDLITQCPFCGEDVIISFTRPNDECWHVIAVEDKDECKVVFVENPDGVEYERS